MTVANRFDAFLVDLDGVVWRGDRVIEGATETIDALRASGRRVVFVTNNASRSPRDYAMKLMRMRIPTEPADIIGSAHVLAAHLKNIGLGQGDRIHVCGTTALCEFLAARRFVPTRDTHDVKAVVVAWNPEATMDDIRRAADVARTGLPFIGANRDATYPSEDGLLPGSGAILAAIETASGRTATVVGKPQPDVFRIALERAGVEPSRALVIGDRPDSDIAGARAAGIAAALVLTGVTSEHELTSLVDRPDFIFESIADVLTDDTSASGEAIVEDRAIPAVSPEDKDEHHPGDETADVSEEGGSASLFDLS